MPILNISVATIHDRAAFDTYLERAGALMQACGVEVVARGTYIETLSGPAAPQHIGAVFRYPDLDAARAFFAAPAYRELIALRDRACDMTIRLYEEPGSAPRNAGGQQQRDPT